MINGTKVQKNEQDKTLLQQVGVTIDFDAWQQFRLNILSVDGVVLFHYLLEHCRNNTPMAQSDKKLENSLGIKRGRLQALRQLFTQAGFLEITVERPIANNPIRVYRINFARLSDPDIMMQIFRTRMLDGQLADVIPYRRFFEQQAAIQARG